MGTANVGTMSAILKDLYLPPVTRQLNDEVYLFQKLTTSNEGIMGNRVVLPFSYGRTGGIGVRTEDTDLPIAGSQTYATAVFDFTSFYGIVRVTGQAMAKTKAQAGAFLEALKSELDAVRVDLKKDLARQIYGDATGQIALCSSVSGHIVTLASDESLRKGQIYPGMIIDFADASGAVVANGAGRSVVSVNITTPSVTIDTATDPTLSSSYIYRAGGTGGSVYNKELNGLAKILPTAANSLGGIDASQPTNAYWDNLRVNAAGALGLDLMEQCAGQQRIAGGQPDLVVTTFGQRRIYGNLLVSQVRFADMQNLKGGFQALDFKGLPLVGDLEAPFGKMYFLETKRINVFQNEDWHFLDQDNSALKWVQNRDAWQAVLARYFQIGTKRRNTSLVLYGLTGDSKGY